MIRTLQAAALPLGAVLFPLALCAVPAAAQGGSNDWAAQVRAAWPGDRIAKASEAEFARFLDDSGARAAGAKAAATSAFLDLQWAAQGLTRPAGLRRFLVPDRVRTTPAGGLLDGVVMEGPEPNGNPNGTPAGTPTVIGGADQGEGAVFPFGDRDWWQLDLTQATSLTVYTMPGNTAPLLDDTLLELYDANSNLLDANDDAVGRGFYSQIEADLVAGRYYVAVRGYADVRTGLYGLEMLTGTTSGGGGRRVSEGPEPNSGFSSAASLGCGNVGFGDITPAFDQDWFSFTVTAPTQVSGATAAGPTGGMDTTLTLIASNGSQLAFDDDGGPGLFSLITQTVQPGTYYFSVAGYASSVGDYELTVTCAGSSGSSASIDVVAGGCPGTVGTPRLFVRAGELPLAGSTFAVDFDTLPAAARVFALIGDSTTQTGGGSPLPIDLTPLGAPGCQVEVAPTVVSDQAATAAGTSALYLGIPASSALLGTTFYVQALVVDPGANSLSLVASNRCAATIGSL